MNLIFIFSRCNPSHYPKNIQQTFKPLLLPSDSQLVNTEGNNLNLKPQTENDFHLRMPMTFTTLEAHDLLLLPSSLSLCIGTENMCAPNPPPAPKYNFTNKVPH
jgi:hypothetical protein